MNLKPKCSGRSEQFFEGVNEKFGSLPGAVAEQHLRNTSYTFALKRQNRRTINGFEAGVGQTVFPIVITQEMLMNFGLVASAISQDFIKAAGQLEVMLDVNIRPITFMHIDDLESLAPYLIDGDVTFPDVLLNNWREDRNGISSLWSTFTDAFITSGNLARKTSTIVEEGFRQLSDDSIERFESGLYLSPPSNVQIRLDEFIPR